MSRKWKEKLDYIFPIVVMQKHLHRILCCRRWGHYLKGSHLWYQNKQQKINSWLWLVITPAERNTKKHTTSHLTFMWVDSSYTVRFHSHSVSNDKCCSSTQDRVFYFFFIQSCIGLFLIPIFSPFSQHIKDIFNKPSVKWSSFALGTSPSTYTIVSRMRECQCDESNSDDAAARDHLRPFLTLGASSLLHPLFITFSFFPFNSCRQGRHQSEWQVVWSSSRVWWEKERCQHKYPLRIGGGHGAAMATVNPSVITVQTWPSSLTAKGRTQQNYLYYRLILSSRHLKFTVVSWQNWYVELMKSFYSASWCVFV